MIGIFDSGIGGLTVVREVIRLLPDHDLVYFGDTARTPYGTKSAETIQRFARQDADFLIAQGATAIVVACNTASAVAAADLKAELSVPVFDVITPVIERIGAVTKNKHVGVIGTRATIFSHVYEAALTKLDPAITVTGKPCPLFVPLVEENWIDKPETKTIAKKYLRPVKLSGIDTLVLGCTHYPLLAPTIGQVMGKRVRLVDPAVEVAATLADWVLNDPAAAKLSKQKRRSFFLSDVTDQAHEIARRWLGYDVRFELAKLE